MKKTSYKHLVEGLQKMGPVKVMGEEYSGGYLALLVSINMNLVESEGTDTIRLIAELGRLTAIARREADRMAREYRQWRDTLVHQLTNDVVAATAAGFSSAIDPGTDAKNVAKPPKCPAVSAAETYIRSLPEYGEHYLRQEESEEAWATIHSVLEAARQRAWMINLLVKNLDDNQFPTGELEPERISGVVEPRSTGGSRTMPPPPPQVTK